MTDKLYSTKEVADRLKLKYGQVIRRIKSHKLQATKVGWGWVVSESALKEYEDVRRTSN